MGKTFRNFKDLERAIQKEVQAAMSEAESKSYLDALENASTYYSGTPKQYKRTYAYANSPRTTGVQGSGNHYEFGIYLDQSFDYDTGTWSTPQIFDAIENGGGGTIGNHGRWEQTEEDIKKNVEEAFRKRFG